MCAGLYLLSHKYECVCDCWHARGGGFSVEPCYFQITVLEVQTIPNNNNDNNNNRIKPE